MATHVMIDWEDKLSTEIEGTDYIQGFRDGMGEVIGQVSVDISIYTKDPWEEVERFKIPAEPPNEPPAEPPDEPPDEMHREMGAHLSADDQQPSRARA